MRWLVLVQAVVVGAGLPVAPADVGVVGAPRRDRRLVPGRGVRRPAVALATGCGSRVATSEVTWSVVTVSVYPGHRVRRDEVGVVPTDRARAPDGSPRAACGCTLGRLGRRHRPMIPPEGAPGAGQRIPRVIALRTAVSIR